MLVALTVLSAVLLFAFPNRLNSAMFLVPLLLSDLVLPPRKVPGFITFLVLTLALVTFLEFGYRTREPISLARWIGILTVLVCAAIVVMVASRRTLGVGGLVGNAMFRDLKERIGQQGTMPSLPAGWEVQVATRAAGGTSFAGDFLVAHRDDGRLSVVVVDVSGKGVDAGTRSLVLSGAFSALLAAAPVDRFLAEANAFLLRQEWAEGFATAVHLCVDLASGEYTVRSAGHPPAVQFRAGAGTWQVLGPAEGPLLGVAEDAVFAPMRGQLGRSDAILLYTDGLVERSTRDIDMGIDRLVGETERLVPSGLHGAARKLVDRLASTDDDCALVILQRH